jgi:hypothetical protein
MKSQEASTRAQGAGVRPPSKLCVRGVAAVLCLLVAAMPAQAAVYWGCIGRLKMFNELRTVNGPVNAECSDDWPFPHSVPWGNWGADTQWNNRYDGFQFPGWKFLGGSDPWQEWNSCTNEFPAPDPGKYNANYNHTQASTLGWTEVAETWLYYEGVTCDAFNYQVITVQGAFMDLWELDPWDEDEFVATLSYNELTAGVYCTGVGQAATCGTLSGASPPSDVYPSGVASAYGSIGGNSYWGSWEQWW